MKLAVIVTEFPKTTETFILRDLMAFHQAGVDLRIYHVAPRRKDQILHAFAKPLEPLARPLPLTALGGALKAPRAALSRAASILRHQIGDGRTAAKSLAMIPGALTLGHELKAWGADHIHAEFAGHPATAAWIAHLTSGVPYSISCRAHDIFRSQRLLAQKFREAAAVRTISEFGRTFLTERVEGIRAEDITVIHSSIDVSRIAPVSTPRGDTFRILYVGALEPKKGVRHLLEALARFERPGWRLDLAGDGPDRASLEDFVRRRDLGGQVHFLGQQNFEAVGELYTRADVCVAPSVIGPNGRTEGIPNVMIEALAYGRPVISSRLSGIPELIVPGKTGWLTEAGDAKGIAAALTEVFDRPDEAARRAAAGRRHVERAFDLRRNSRRQLQLFDPDGAWVSPRLTGAA